MTEEEVHSALNSSSMRRSVPETENNRNFSTALDHFGGFLATSALTHNDSETTVPPPRASCTVLESSL